MFKIEDKIIHCTRGDEGKINFTCKNTDGSDYLFQSNQKVILKVYEKGNVTNVVLKKETVVIQESTSITIELTSEDTTIGDYINKPVTYNYEISINGTKTIVGYDDEGPKQFILYPEGGNDEI